MLSKFQCWRCDRETREGITCNKCHKAYYCSKKCSSDDKYRHSSDCDDMALRYVCRGCGKSEGKMMMCSNCMKAWFCGQECLEKVFKKEHKKECKEMSYSVQQLAKGLQLKNHESGKFLPILYYFGNTPALDLLNTLMNEGQEYSQPLYLLLCGVGDPRSVCLTISKLQPTYNANVHFVLNDISHCTLARAVLLLYMLSKVGPDKANSVVQVWYSLHLSQQDHVLLVSCLEDLVGGVSSIDDITRGTMKTEDQEQFMKLKEVWQNWLCLSRQENGLTQQRSEMFKSDAQEGMRYHLNEIPKKHRHSMDRWFKYGVLLSEKKRENARKENITLTGSTFFSGESFKYKIGSDCMPFCCWDYKDACKAYPEINDVNELYNQYITDVLTICAERLQSDQIHISFLLCNCVEVPTFIQDKAVKFDRITTSNLWDYIPLPKLFATLKPLLNSRNTSATILTESQNWEGCFPFLVIQKVGLRASSELRQRIHRDTGNQAIAQSDGHVGLKDYLSFVDEFTCFARASLLDVSKECKSFIPSLDQLAAEYGLKPRDFVNHGNTISPLRWQLNCRRITMLRGTEYSVEWTSVAE